MDSSWGRVPQAAQAGCHLAGIVTRAIAGLALLLLRQQPLHSTGKTCDRCTTHNDIRCMSGRWNEWKAARYTCFSSFLAPSSMKAQSIPCSSLRSSILATSHHAYGSPKINNRVPTTEETDELTCPDTCVSCPIIEAEVLGLLTHLKLRWNWQLGLIRVLLFCAHPPSFREHDLRVNVCVFKRSLLCHCLHACGTGRGWLEYGGVYKPARSRLGCSTRLVGKFCVWNSNSCHDDVNCSVRPFSP